MAERKKRKSPGEGRTLAPVRVEQEVLATIDRMAADRGVTRSDVLREVIDAGLASVA